MWQLVRLDLMTALAEVSNFYASDSLEVRGRACGSAPACAGDGRRHVFCTMIA